MKKIKYTIIATLLACFSCSDFLETEPIGFLGNDEIITSPEAVTAYFATMYMDLPIEDFNYHDGRFGVFPGNADRYTADYIIESSSNQHYRGTSMDRIYPKMYSLIRLCNEFLQTIEDNRDNITLEQYAEYSGETRFLRGFAYYGLAKRWGGVPILLEAQEYVNNDLTSLRVARNTEEETWDHIKSDFEFAMNNMGETSVYGRANKYVAAAYLSRAMLFAGSVAKYGVLEDNKLTGIPETRAEDFFQTAFDAASMVMNSSNYDLYDKRPNKTENFRDLFLDYSNNPEIILAKGFDYDATFRTHSQDFMAFPKGFLGGYGNKRTPSYNLVQKFEPIEGGQPNGNGEFMFPFPINISNNNNKILYESPSAIFEGRDPRMAATVLLPFTTFRGQELSMQAGVVTGVRVNDDGVTFRGGRTRNQGRQSTFYDLDSNSFIDDDTGIMGTGVYGSSNVRSGFYLRKYADETTSANELGAWQSRTHWIDMRYAEVLLNYAEAALQLDNVDDATMAINLVRERAGIATLPSSDVTLNRIWHEREVELAFESKTLWDMIRTRRLVEKFNDTRVERLRIYRVLDPDLEDPSKTLGFTIQRQQGARKTYRELEYYARIPVNEISSNPLLIQNPGY